VHAKYWQSSHFTKEYIAYFDLRATQHWKQQFIKQNHLVATSGQIIKPLDSPDWFRFSANSKCWQQPNGGSSIYIEDANTGHLLIYEEQL
jgi:hypothetical protein